MAQKNYINIQFPFQDDPDGKFLKLNTGAKQAIKSDLVHLLLTNKGERLYLPNFGANLRQYLFEPNDDTVANSIKNEINQGVAIDTGAGFMDFIYIMIAYGGVSIIRSLLPASVDVFFEQNENTFKIFLTLIANTLSM